MIIQSSVSVPCIHGACSLYPVAVESACAGCNEQSFALRKMGCTVCRWALWLLRLETDLAQGRRYDPDAWRLECQNYTLGWAYLQEQLPVQPQGDTVAVSQRLYQTYGPDWTHGMLEDSVMPMEIDQL